MPRLFLILFAFILFNCASSDDTPSQDDTGDVVDETDAEEINSPYFPPLNSADWETVSMETLGWNTAALSDLSLFLEDTNTKAFLILKDGKIAWEQYFQGTTMESQHRWNSAAKTLTAMTVQRAYQEGLLDIHAPTSTYLGTGWTSMAADQELQITPWHQLTMTSGGEYDVDNLNCTLPSCLTYRAEAGSQWYYHNAFYILLQEVVTQAVEVSFNSYFYENIQQKIGMEGYWQSLGFARLYYSNARSMARFGLLNLRDGVWEEDRILDTSYLNEMIQTSQDLNQAYGYLWWLNGKDSYRLPGVTFPLNGKLIPSAPDDLVAGLGKDDQKLYIVPSQGLVIVRLGDETGQSTQGPSGFDTSLWDYLNELIVP